MMALTNRVKKSVETWESMSLSKSNRGGDAAAFGINSFEDVIEDLNMSMSSTTADTPRHYSNSSNANSGRRQTVSRTARRRHKRLTVSGVFNK